MLSREATNTNFIYYPWFDPTGTCTHICRTRGEHTSHHTTNVIATDKGSQTGSIWTSGCRKIHSVKSVVLVTDQKVQTPSFSHKKGMFSQIPSFNHRSVKHVYSVTDRKVLSQTPSFIHI
jgi:hypothetical protein